MSPFDLDAAVGNVLLDTYAKWSCVDAAEAVLAGIKERNVVTWLTLISRFGGHGLGEEALRIYQEILAKG